MRGGRAALGGPVAEGPAAGGRRFGRRPRGPDPGRLLQDLAHPPRLELHDRAAARPRRSEAVLAARQADRRFVVDQRDDLHARRRGRLRRVGRADRRPVLVVRERAAGVPPHGGQRPRGRRVPRNGRSAAGRGPPLAAPVDPRRRPVGRGRRVSAQRRLQRAPARRRRAVPGDPEARTALVGGRRLPAPRHGPPEPDRPDRRADHPRARRGRPGDRRRIPQRRPRAHRPGHPRGRAVGRGDQHPAAADALGHRAGRAPARGRRRRRPRPAGCRGRVAGPPARAGRVERAVREVAAAGRVAGQPGQVEGPGARPAHLEPGRVGAVHPVLAGAGGARPPVPLPAGEVLEAGGDRPGRRGLQRR